MLKASNAYPGAKGKAKFQVTGQRELEIEVEHVRRLAGKRVNFFVGSTRVGSARINGFGAAQINRRGSSFPAVRAGTVIKVKTARGRRSSPAGSKSATAMKRELNRRLTGGLEVVLYWHGADSVSVSVLDTSHRRGVRAGGRAGLGPRRIPPPVRIRGRLRRHTRPAGCRLAA